MQPSNNCSPSGHSRCSDVINSRGPPARHVRFASPDHARCYEVGQRPQQDQDNFAGPYKNYDPPGSRTPVVGERIWGDHPYLPSYLDPMYPVRNLPYGPPHNLLDRGPFYKGVSETHHEYVNRGLPPPREYKEYVRHYEEPGLKYDKSITQTDYTPPLPMLPRDKTPCLKEEPPKAWYTPEPKEPKNYHSKELVVRSAVPQVVFIEEEPKWELTTEHEDNYICYQGPKDDTKIKDMRSIPEEIFLDTVRSAHAKCRHSPPPDDPCDEACRSQKKCQGPAQDRTPWLMYPINYSFKNGVMLLPCRCRGENQ